MDRQPINTNRYYLSGDLQNVLDSKQIICYCINIQLSYGEDKMQQYRKRKLTAVCSHQTRIGNLDAHLI
ncbi:hypothetical protein FCX53_25430 [Escherichia coli]|nr:hypothetical protein [Escherichia coli]